MKYVLTLTTRDSGIFHKEIDNPIRGWVGEAFHIANNFLWVECTDATGKTVVLRTSEIVTISKSDTDERLLRRR